MRLKGHLFVIGCCILCGGTSKSQIATTSLQGTVIDPSGLRVTSAVIVLNDPSHGFRQETHSANFGEYSFQQLQPGQYTVEVFAAGFTREVRNVTLLVNQPRTLNFSLTTGMGITNIDVNAGETSLNTVDASIGSPFTTAQIQGLPFEGNNVLDLLSLQAGVLFLGDKTSQQQDSDSRSGVVEGARSDQTNVTLDGLDDNDQNKGYAFSGVLRSTRDSVEEFRVVTTGVNADSGRSSGAQVALVTRSGTNSPHGSVYEYYRPPNAVANDWFNKQSEIEEGEPNEAPRYLRNTFGASFGGPIKKNKLFYFIAYEGQHTDESRQVTQEVPNAAFRSGELTYVAGAAATSPAPTSCDASGSCTFTLSSAQIASLDPRCRSNGSCPLGPGVNSAAESYYAQLPLPNGEQLSDGYNLMSYTFASPAPQTLNTVIGKVDYNIHNRHQLMLRGNYQEDHSYGTIQFPGQPPSYEIADNSKGIAAGDIWTISSTLVNNLRYGLVRQGFSNRGVTHGDYVTFQNIASVNATGYTSQMISVPTHNIVDDLTVSRGRHTVQLGGNYRLIFNNRQSDSTLYKSAMVTYLFLDVGAIANTSVQGQPPASLDPSGFGLPAVSPGFATAYNIAIGDITGLVTSSTINYNNHYANGELSPLPAGEWVKRRYLTDELEYYVQDSWKIRPDVTLTLGLRHALLQVPFERDGQEIAPTVDLNKWFETRRAGSNAGRVIQPSFGFTQAGRANNKPGLWNMEKLALAPRFAIAYSLNSHTTLRAGAGVFFDHFGQGIVDSFDQQGSFGLVTADRSPYYQQVDTTPRFSNNSTVPTSIVPPVSTTGPTPVSPGDNLILAWGIDQSLTTPYSYVFSSSVQHQLKGSFILEGSYIGRLGRHLLQMRDVATPNDLVDPNGGGDYFAAATALSKLTDANVPVSSVKPIPYWERMFPWLAQGGLSATQGAYQQYIPFRGNEGAALFVLDAVPGITPAAELNRYYDPQYSSLYVWSSVGTSSYHSLQVSLHHALSHGLQFDAYYTLSKSIDLGSDTERTGPSTESVGGAGGYYSSGGGYASQIINVFHPKGNRGVSDFDVRHSISGNAAVNLPFGRGEQFGSGTSRLGNAIIGKWSLTALSHWTSGLPFSSFDGLGWSTDWAEQSWNVATGSISSGGHRLDAGGQPNAFKSQSTAISNIRPPYPGETGERNYYRGDGYFSVDSGLSKVIAIRSTQTIKFSWEAFNTFNSVRFDPASISTNPFGNPGSYGRYSALLTQGRRMQLSLRYSF